MGTFVVQLPAGAHGAAQHDPCGRHSHHDGQFRGGRKCGDGREQGIRTQSAKPSHGHVHGADPPDQARPAGAAVVQAHG